MSMYNYQILQTQLKKPLTILLWTKKKYSTQLISCIQHKKMWARTTLVIPYYSKTLLSPYPIPVQFIFNTTIFLRYLGNGKCWPYLQENESHLPYNYKSITLLICVGKPFERMLFKHMNHFLHSRNFIITIIPIWFWIRSLNCIATYWKCYRTSKSLDKREYPRMMFCGISKAFDRLWAEDYYSNYQATASNLFYTAFRAI